MKVAAAQDIEQMWHYLFFRCCICKPQKMISVVEDDNWNVQCGYIISLYRDDNTFSAIAWKSIITKRVVKSTLPAERLALEQVLESYFMIKSRIWKLEEKDWKLMCIIHEMIAKKEVYSIEWCKSEPQLTDC